LVVVAVEPVVVPVETVVDVVGILAVVQLKTWRQFAHLLVVELQQLPVAAGRLEIAVRLLDFGAVVVVAAAAVAVEVASMHIGLLVALLLVAAVVDWGRLSFGEQACWLLEVTLAVGLELGRLVALLDWLRIAVHLSWLAVRREKVCSFVEQRKRL